MRLLLTSSAAIALSGCSFMSTGHSGHSGYSYTAPAAHQSCSSQPAYAGCLSQWNLEGAAGQEFMVGGEFTTPGDVAPLVGLTPNGVSMKDAYDPGTRYELGVSRALNPSRKLTLMASYSNASGNDIALGTLAGPPANTLRGTASDYETYGVEAGLRQYFRPTYAPIVNTIRPYVEARIGAANVSDITLENLRDNGGAVNGGTAAMYDGGWVPTAAGLVGVETPIFSRATLGLETGIRYRGALKANTTDFGPGGGVGILTGINNGSENYTVPVMLRGRYRF